MLNRSETQVALPLVALLVAPTIGFLAMTLAWLVVTSDWRGQMDIGVMLIGASVAATSVGVFSWQHEISLRSAAPWLAGAFLLTFAIAFGVVWLFYAGPFSFDFSAMD